MCRESHSGAIKTAASDAHPCARTDDEWLFSLLVLWGLGGSFRPRQAGRWSATGLEGGTPR